jgi:ADP-ribose pyrophosphatase YjhB (NUDIX family)
VDPNWLAWAKRLETLAQNGLTYSTNPYDTERYEEVRAVAVEMLAARSDVDPAHVRDLFARERGHITPKVDVRGAVFRDDRILLVRERSDGRWTLPGGWADPGESPADSVAREVYEESGYRTRVTKLLAVYDRDKHGHPPLPYYVYKMFFLCSLLDDEPEDRGAGEQHRGRRGPSFAETDEVAFFPADALPDLSLTRVTPAQIGRLFAHHHHPAWPADFD